MIDWHPVIHWYIFGIREILLVDAHHAVIDRIWGLISCVSLDINQCLHILFQGICALLLPRGCCVIIELVDWLCGRYLHGSLCWLHLILCRRRRVFSLRRVRLALRSCLFVLLSTFRAFVFEPNLYSAFRKVYFHGHFLSHEDVRIFCFGEELVQYFQLRFGEGGSFTSLLSWGPFKKPWH